MRKLLLTVAAAHREGDRIFVAVRNCEADVALGDALAPAGARDASIVVRVVSILVYGHYMNVLDSGLTAELALEGTGVDGVSPGVEIVGVSREPCPPLELLGTGEMRIPRPRV